MKRRYFPLLIILSALILAGAIFTIFLPKVSFSENENRILKTFPEFSFENVLNAKYMKGFEDYISDHFVLRDIFHGVHSISERARLRFDSGGVYFASHDKLIEQFDKFNQNQFNTNLTKISEFYEANKDKIDVKVLMAPTSSKIYESYLLPFAPEVSQDKLLDLYKNRFNADFIDTRATLLNHNDEYIYFNTDHHWTMRGTFYAYNEYLRALNLPTHEISEYETSFLTDSFYGTTYSKSGFYLNPADKIEYFDYKAEKLDYKVEYFDKNVTKDSVLALEKLQEKDKYQVFFDGNHSLIKLENNVKNTGRNLLIAKDSYANCFIPFLLNEFDSITVLDLRYYKRSVKDLLQKENITHALILYNIKNISEDTNVFVLSR